MKRLEYLFKTNFFDISELVITIPEFRSPNEYSNCHEICPIQLPNIFQFDWTAKIPPNL